MHIEKYVPIVGRAPLRTARVGWLKGCVALILVLTGLPLSTVQSGGRSANLAQAAPSTVLASNETPNAKVESLVYEMLEATGQVDFFVWMAEEADLSQTAQFETRAEQKQHVFETQRDTAEDTQKSLRAYLDRQGVDYHAFYIVNKILIRDGDTILVNRLAARSDVAKITANHTYQLEKPSELQDRSQDTLAALSADATSSVGSNLIFINADDVWSLTDAVTGEGIVLAAIDTGLDETHPAIARHYRGCQNSPDCTSWDHNYNWWDATDTYSNDPYDGDGHGTHVTGTMVGNDGAGDQIGVAPGAETIHCKALDDSGTGTDATITECLEWTLAPWDLTGSNPDPSKAPDVVNLSWGTAGGNALQFEDEIAALQAAGILVVAAAGNEGPSCGTLGSPGDYAPVLTVGSVAHTSSFPGTVDDFSSRGPSRPYPGAYFPDVMAPGNSIRSAQPGGTYASLSGTSMASPHVAGLVALMWSANPDLRGLIAQTAQIIADTAVPLTGQTASNCGGDYTNGPNSDWGNGTIDAYAAVQAALTYGSAGNIIRVTASGATSGACGSDWSTPCALQYALDSVATVGDELWVAAGIYKPTTSTTDQTAYIRLKADVDVYGGFAGSETARSQRDPQTNITIFSGDIDSNDSQTPIITDASTVTGNTTNSYHVVAGTPTNATLDGVTITGGYGYYGCGYGWNSQFGGGLYTQGSMTINNVTFSGNQSFYGGGVRTTAPLTITNSTFTGNYATSTGGGLSNGGLNTTLINVTFTNNRATSDGAGAANNTTYAGEPSGSLILTNVTFSDNWAGTNAGGLYVEGAASLADVAFTHNRGNNLGGGMTIAGTSPVTLDRVTFTDNYGPTSGGGLGSWSGHVTLSNVTFSGNSAVGSGGAIEVGPQGGVWTLNNVLITGNSANVGGGISTAGQMTLTNVTVANNSASGYASGIASFSTVVIRNSIVWGNGICAEGYGGCGSTTVSYSDVQGGWAGTGNISTDPLLAPLGDYGGSILSRAILPGSPAIDAGETTTCLTTDQRGMARSSPCDLGAFELTNTGAATTISLISAPNPVAYGASVTFTATVTSTGDTPNGAVQFNADGVPLGSSVTLSGGEASMSTSSLSIGVHSIAATYTGDASHNISTTQINQTVDCTGAMLVTNANDDGAGSLRAALRPLCAGGTITFDDDYTVTLASSLTIDKSMRIDGIGHHVTLNGNHSTRVFYITGGTVVLDHLTIANGAAPFECGPWNDYCGGAIWMQNAGTNVTLQNSTLSGNSGARGGGIYNYNGTLTVRNSTFYGNSATQAAGGIFNNGGTLNVANSTFYGNSGPDTDLSQNRGGGAIFIKGNLNVTDSILWGDSGTEIVGNIWSGNTTYSDIRGGWSGTGNVDVDPLLMPLGDYGGSTQTLALPAGSPAIDAGNPAGCLTTDQRGEARNDLRCDIGAFERVYTDGDTVIKTFADGTQHSFGPTLVGVTLATTNTGSITATKYLSTPTGLGDAAAMGVTWRLTHSLTAGFPLTLTLCYTADELGSLTEADLRAYRWNGTTWEGPLGDAPANRCVTVSNVTAFSEWTLAASDSPSAVGVRGFGARNSALAAVLLAGVGAAMPVLIRKRRHHGEEAQ